MKVLGFFDFCALPDGTIFMELHGNNPGPLHIRGNVYFNSDTDKPQDFICAPLVPTCENDGEIVTPWGFCRWALFDFTAKFLVFEEADCKRLAGWLLDPKVAMNQMNDDPHASVVVV